jgi:hypothetical protein
MEKSSCLNTDDGLTHNDLQLVAKSEMVDVI